MHRWQLELWVVEWGWYLSLLTALFLSECFFLSGLLDYHIHVIIFIIRSHDCQGEKWSRQRVCGLEAQKRKEKPEADREKTDLGFCGEVDPPPYCLHALHCIYSLQASFSQGIGFVSVKVLVTVTLTSGLLLDSAAF